MVSRGSGGAAEFANQRRALLIEASYAFEVVVGLCGGQFVVEFDEAAAVGGARGGIEQRAAVTLGDAGASEFEYVHVGAGSGQQDCEVG